ncbi:MAG: trypsin-like peptidase domain-containing protein [Clostridiales bacterium]|jgi:serine protease Do|nr:trypsin-like peptidase domain-containing protein [Clostridiales bacterium]
MDDRRDQMLDMGEIERIQQEIERNLFTGPPASETPADPVPQAQQAQVQQDQAQPEPELDEPEQAKQTEPEEPQSALYRETIKHETIKHKKKKKNRLLVAIAIIVCTLGTGTLGIGIGMAIPYAQKMIGPGLEALSEGKNNDKPPVANALKESPLEKNDDGALIINSLSDVVSHVAPSVVSITTSTPQETDFFEIPDMTGAASGIIFFKNDSKIYIATNYHVVSGANSVNVYFDDSDPVPATFVGSEPDADLAVISITWADAKKAGITSVALATFGDSDTAKMGDTVIAIGNALGEGKTATSGIVSAINKEVEVEEKTLTVIQTDAAINPGNSGGPLVNTAGQVIGINTAKLNRVAQVTIEGMGYSITSNVAKPIIEEIMLQKPKPFLGIKGSDVSAEMSEMYGITLGGVYVAEVLPDTSADKGGLMRNDIITSFNGTSIFSMAQLQEEIAACKVGDLVEVKVYREGKTPMKFQLRLSAYKSDNF